MKLITAAVYLMTLFGLCCAVSSDYRIKTRLKATDAENESAYLSLILPEIKLLRERNAPRKAVLRIAKNASQSPGLPTPPV